MADALNKLYDQQFKKNPDGSTFSFFQAGFTAAAVSMRSRAIKAAQGKKDVNEIINAIGQLSDIPQE